MDTLFWAGLAIGGLLSIPLSITANIWTDLVRDYLDKRRKIRLSNKKWKEVRTYFYVRALREGDPTATLLLDFQQHDASRALMFMSLCFVMELALLYVLIVRQAQVKEHVVLFLSLVGVIGFCALFFYYYSTSLHWRMIRIRFRLMRFAEYETSIRVKWGDDALEEFISAYLTKPTE